MVKTILENCQICDKFTFLDVGANIGWYSLNVLREYPMIKVFSFEPSPITYERLKGNFVLNNFSTKGLVNMGLYKEKSTLDFYYDAEGSGASSLVNLRGKENINRIKVNVEKLDRWVEENNIDGVDFIKCDVEGSELFVYQGGENVISKYKPIVFSEMLRKWSAKFGYHPNDIIAFFSKFGYECFVINDGRLISLKKVLDSTVETNYFFLHKEKHESIILNLC